VNGIKGISPLMFLKYIDPTTVFAADWMHGVLLGVTKALLRFWLESKYRNETFFIGHQVYNLILFIVIVFLLLFKISFYYNNIFYIKICPIVITLSVCRPSTNFVPG